MSNLLLGICRTSILISYVLLFVTIGDASVSWRRVIKPSTRVHETTLQPTTISPTKLATKTPITWKRSTIARRSTDAAESRLHPEEQDDLNKASSEKDEDFEELDKNSDIKPLVPGSRPGFWFDSSRRKKPASLLRPGTRRNSLFPTRASTTEAPARISTTPFPIIPRTLPETSNSLVKNISTKLFSRNRPSKPKITFRRRLKTTEVPKTTTTADVNNSDEFKEDDLITDSPNNSEKEEEEEVDLEKSLAIKEEDDDSKPKKPKFNIRRRRPYNGTRLSWTKKRIIRTTTAAPQQLTTTSVSVTSTKDSEKDLRRTVKFPRIRINSGANSTSVTDIVRSKTKERTNKPDGAPIINSNKLKNTIKNSTIEKENNSSNLNEESLLERNLDEEDLEENTENLDKAYGTRQSSAEQRKYRSKTTVEPFYITKEYGIVATAIPDITKSFGSKESLSNQTLNVEIDNAAQQIKNANPIETFSTSSKKEKKRTRTQIKEAPKITSMSEKKSQNIEHEDDYNEDNDVPFEYIDDFMPQYTTTENPVTTKIDKSWTEKKLVSTDMKRTTTLRPVTLPFVPTIDPNSNAYVVWSVGHGGSGWSYEKQGGKVKWSAQNSEAEGDSWSVVSKEEEDNNPNYHWTPIRTDKNSAKSAMNTKGKLDKGNTPANVPVTYIPRLSFKNETILTFKKDPPSQIFNKSFTDLNYPARLIYTNNVTSSANNSPKVPEEVTQSANVSSLTPPPFHPTIEDQFNEEVGRIINGYPVSLNYPYIAEIRETFDSPPITPTNTPTTGLYEFQEYITENMDANHEKEHTPPISISQDEQFAQVPQLNSYPYAENKPPYTDLTKNVDINTNVNEYSTANVPYQNYQSSIPPELAKAVVKAKKWRVIENGGNDGWSLLNEDGILEWKIHNIDGHWRVTSAEELAKIQSQSQSTAQATDNNTPQAELYGHNEPVPEEYPRVWTFDDDYAKWRAISTERGIPKDESSEESSSSSEEYDYDNEDFSDSYYPNNDYDSFEQVNHDHTTYRFNGGNSERPPVLENDKKLMNPTYLQTAQFSGNIEAANSRDDAIEAWKSLLAQYGHWKISDEIRDRMDQYSSDETEHTPKTINIRDRRIPATSETNKKNLRDQNKFHKIVSDKHGGENQYQGYKNEYDREDGISHQGKHDKNNEVSVSFKQQDSPLYLRTHENYSNNINHPHPPAEGHFLTPNIDVYHEKYDTLTKSLKRKFHNFEDKQNSDKYPLDLNQENYQKQKENKFYDLDVKFLEHNNKGKKEAGDVNDQVEKMNSQSIKDNKNNIEKKENILWNHYEQSHHHSLFKNNSLENGRIPERNAEKIINLDTTLKNKDHSKVESLIKKLEDIQREAKGRAVIDITALLNQMRARRNATSSILDHDKAYTEKHHGILAEHQNRKTASNAEGSNTTILPKNVKTENMPTPKYFHKHVPHESQTENLNQEQRNLEHKSNGNVEKDYSITSENHSFRHSGPINKIKRRKRPLSRTQNSRMNYLSINQTTSLNRTPNIKEFQRDNYILRNTTGKTKNIFRERENKHTFLSHTPQLNPGMSRSDSSNSEEHIVNLREIEKKRPSIPRRRKRPSHKRSRRPYRLSPIIMKGETEVEDETGSKKSRKIIVIDYAGSKPKRNSVDKKDLELIIRNVKHRRSEMREEITGN